MKERSRFATIYYKNVLFLYHVETVRCTIETELFLYIKISQRINV